MAKNYICCKIMHMISYAHATENVSQWCCCRTCRRSVTACCPTRSRRAVFARLISFASCLAFSSAQRGLGSFTSVEKLSAHRRTWKPCFVFLRRYCTRIRSSTDFWLCVGIAGVKKSDTAIRYFTLTATTVVRLLPCMTNRIDSIMLTSQTTHLTPMLQAARPSPRLCYRPGQWHWQVRWYCTTANTNTPWCAALALLE